MNTPVLIETQCDDGVEWGLSLGGSNPKPQDYFQMVDAETAFRLRDRLLAEFSPVSGDEPVSVPSDEF